MTLVGLRRAARIVATLAFGALLASCASFRPKGRIIAGPSGAIGAAALSNDRAAVLSGTGTTRAVFVIDLKSGSTERSFGVTREASGMAAATPSGPLLISIAGTDKRGGAIGAIEQWSLDGRKLATLPAAGPVMAITQVVDGTAYILVRGNGKARAAVRLLPVEILRYVCVEDCGVVVNPQVVDGQCRGGIAQGIAGALFEEITYDDQGAYQHPDELEAHLWLLHDSLVEIGAGRLAADPASGGLDYRLISPDGAAGHEPAGMKRAVPGRNSVSCAMPAARTPLRLKIRPV